jgi:hypothetical protein
MTPYNLIELCQGGTSPSAGRKVPGSSVDTYHHIEGAHFLRIQGRRLFYPEDEDSLFLRNVEASLPNYTAPVPRMLEH